MLLISNVFIFIFIDIDCDYLYRYLGNNQLKDLPQDIFKNIQLLILWVDL